MKLNRRSIKAADDLDNEVIQDEPVADVEVDPSATDLLFEAEDVATLLAEATGQAVDVVADEDTVTFNVGEDTFTVEAEGDEEIVESSVNKVLRGRKPVAASRKPAAKPAATAPVKASRNVSTARTFRKVPSARK